MPLLRGAAYALLPSSAVRSHAVVVLTTNAWNSTMTQVGAVVVRREVDEFEIPHVTELASLGRAVGCAVVSIDAPPQPSSVIGPLVRMLSPDELSGLEERVCAFLDLPRLRAGRPIRPELPGDATTYPVWGDVYRAGPPIDGERKRYVIVSPNRWNCIAPYFTVVRTTSRDKANLDAFPLIQRDTARASSGDLSLRGKAEILLAPRDRPTPRTLTYADMAAIAKGIVFTHGLEAALARLTP